MFNRQSQPPIPQDYALPDVPDGPSECLFYHTMDLPGVGQVDGQWDLRGAFEDYVGGVEVAGKACLDLGTASGFLSFEMERRGGDVVSFDADHATRIEFLPLHGHAYTMDHAVWCQNTNSYLGRLHRGYWFAHAALGSRNRVYHGDIYRLPTFLGTFDIVVMGQVLVHLSNPIGAMAEAARLCRDTLVIAEGTLPGERDTVGKIFARAASGGPPYIWWQFSEPLYREILAMMGFEIVSVTTRPYLCRACDWVDGDVPVTTIVARRRVTGSDRVG